jgi:DNA-binding beta-propeller fold protein YncE
MSSATAREKVLVRGEETDRALDVARTVRGSPRPASAAMRRTTATAIVMLAALVSACGGSQPRTGGIRAASRPSARVALTAPGCTTAVGHEPRLTAVRTALVSVPARPFGIVTTADARWTFVSTAHGLAVLANRTFAPRLTRTLRLPSAAQGLALTPDGRYLLAADNGSGALVIDAQLAERGERHAVIGVIRSAAGPGAGAIEVVISPDSRYAFVTLEAAGELAVFDLRAAIAAHLRNSGYVGLVPVGVAPVGMAMSPDGRWLYVASELAPGSNPLLPSAHGTLSVVDVRRAETNPPRSVAAAAIAGCTPVRVATSPDGRTVWVTARGSDALLGFSASRLLTDSTKALTTDVRVGAAPVGVAVYDDGRRIIVADSNDPSIPGAEPELSVIDAARALAHRRGVLCTIPAARYPRELTLEPNTTVALVTNYGAGVLEAVDLTRTP